MTREIFLDNNATTRPLPEVTAAVVAAMSEFFGNPSSANRSGERARRLLRDTRERSAALIGTPADAVHFTSGATEANNWACNEFVSNLALRSSRQIPSIRRSKTSAIISKRME